MEKGIGNRISKYGIKVWLKLNQPEEYDIEKLTYSLLDRKVTRCCNPDKLYQS